MTSLALSARRLKSSLTTGDRILFILFLSLSLGSYFWVDTMLGRGSFAVITSRTQSPVRIPLARATVFRIDGTNGEVEIQVKDGKVRITEANCPHQVCVRQGWIGRTGEVLVCVPNAISIWIEGKLTSQIDAFTG